MHTVVHKNISKRMLAVFLLTVSGSVSHAVAQEHQVHADVHGAETKHGAHHNADRQVTWSDLVHDEKAWQQLKSGLVSFLVFGFVAVFFARKKVKAALVARKHSVVIALEEAKAIKEAAEKKHKEYTDRLAKLDSEIDQIRADMVRAGEVERDRIVADAEKKAARMRRDASFLIEQRIKQLRKDLLKEAVEAAVATAETVLGEQTTAADQTRLADSYLASLSTLANSSMSFGKDDGKAKDLS